jgi:bacillithiol biosynthesis cysteine-adding enzyme BshC
MQLDKIPLADTRAFSPFFLDYIQQKETLYPYYHRFPAASNFSEQIAEKSKSFSRERRQVLVDVVQQQYEGLTLSKIAEENIQKLGEANCFTITTGHQLNIFTGPLYFIYKIITVINTCRELKKLYPESEFVPVYWMASEDHDYEEIKYFNLYNKRYDWNTNQRGAVGRFNTAGLGDIAKSLPGDAKVFIEAYTRHNNLSDAVRCYVNALFGEYGVVVVDADEHRLKMALCDVVERDIFQQETKQLVDSTNRSLEQAGYKTQVHCRDINFFYLDDGIRSRIEKTGDKYIVLDTDLAFEESEVRKLIKTQPEKFSPNVILRPLYQELILPNLAYIGGPAELVYWLQLKAVFDHVHVPFPMLMPRNFALIVEHQIARKREKTGLEMSTFFEDKNFIFNHWMLNFAPHDLTAGSATVDLERIFSEVRTRAQAIDKTLEPMVGAEAARALKAIQKIEHKFMRAGKRLHVDKLRQIEAVKDALFPKGGLQERTDNFLNFHLRDTAFIDDLIANLDPFDFRFNVMTYSS